MIIKKGRKRLLHWLIMLSVLFLVAANAGAEDENKWPLCVGEVVFDIPENIIVTSVEGALGQLSSIRKIDNSSFRADIYYGPASLSPYAPPENVPSTKIDMGSIDASLTCIATQDGLKSCHIACDIADTSEKIIVFFYSHLSEADSMIADSIWKSAHRDESCQTKE